MKTLKRVLKSMAMTMAVIAVFAIVAGLYMGMAYVLEEWFGDRAVLAALIVGSVLTGISAIVTVSLTAASSRSDLEGELIICKDDISNYKKMIKNKDEHHTKEKTHLENKVKDLENNLKLARQHEEEIKTKCENLEKTRDIQQKQIFNAEETSKRLEKDLSGAIDRYEKLVEENARITEQSISYAELEVLSDTPGEVMVHKMANAG